MLPVNVVSFVEAWRTLETVKFVEFSKVYGITVKENDQEAGNAIRGHELKSMMSMVECLHEAVSREALIEGLDGFYIGYKIPHIGTEFDLLKVGEGVVLNIELKSCVEDEKMRKQFRKSAFYLRHLSEHPMLYIFDEERKAFFRWNRDQDDFITVCPLDVMSVLKGFPGIVASDDLDEKFSPSKFLVSPFNHSDAFIQNRYFLTQGQVEIKNKLLCRCGALGELPKSLFYSIAGGPGTGKSLLMYDIAKELMESRGKKVIIVHCGNLNKGHEFLKGQGWDIIAAKDLNRVLKENRQPFAFFVDEAQRFKKLQFDKLCKYSREKGIPCLFCYDGRQTLSKTEINSDVAAEIDGLTKGNRYDLKKTIRSNDSIMCFIEALFSKKKCLHHEGTRSVSISYYTSPEDVIYRLKHFERQGYAVVNYTPSLFKNKPVTYSKYAIEVAPNVHEIIGQEFDKVAVVIDERFTYCEDGMLVIREEVSNQVYLQDRMMYQIATRAVSALHVIVLNNPEVLERCCQILGITS